jgi:hypothetical protein
MVQKHSAKLLGVIVAIAAAIAVVAPVASAAPPPPPYSQFVGCPNEAKIGSCLHSVVTGGHVKLGSKEVPIEKPIPLNGGIPVGFGPLFFTSEGGLGVVKQKVPGGVIGLTGLTWLAEFLGSEALTLYAATELAGTPIIEGLESIRLPVKAHLINGALGNNCYVGSTSNPIALHLLLTNQPKLTFNFETEVLAATGAIYEDKTFSAPGASGCVLTLFGFIPISINGLVNTASGLPAATGNNTVQNINTELVERELVFP